MPISATLLPEFDLEMANTRRVLERVPDAKLDFRPHAKSYSVRELATHLSNLPYWVSATLEMDALDLALTPREQPVSDAQTALLQFDQKLARGRAALLAADDAKLRSDWSLQMGGQTIFTMPKLAVLRSFVLNHMIHHRGQMTVYLRLCDVALPGLYGPTADEAN